MEGIPYRLLVLVALRLISGFRPNNKQICLYKSAKLSYIVIKNKQEKLSG